MGFVDYVKQGWEIVKLNERAMSRVASDADATKMGLLFLVIAGIASTIGTLTILAILPVIVTPIITIIAYAIIIGVFHILAKLFGGNGQYTGLFRVLSVGSVLSWIAVVPVIGAFLVGIAGLWSIVVSVVAVRTVHKVSTGKAVAVVLIPIIIIAILAAIIAAALIAALAGLFGGAALLSQ